MEYKKYTQEEFEEFEEANMFEDNFGLFECIKEQKVNLSMDENNNLVVRIETIDG